MFPHRINLSAWSFYSHVPLPTVTSTGTFNPGTTCTQSDTAGRHTLPFGKTTVLRLHRNEENILLSPAHTLLVASLLSIHRTGRPRVRPGLQRLDTPPEPSILRVSPKDHLALRKVPSWSRKVFYTETGSCLRPRRTIVGGLDTVS